MKLFVPDTSCLILFYQLDKFQLLEEIIDILGGKLILLSSVIAELRSVPKNALGSTKYERIKINNYQRYQNQFNLGKGEASILKYGETMKIIAIIDDFRARKIAAEMGIDVKGTMGLLGAGYILCPIKTKEELIAIFHKAAGLGFRLPPVEPYVRAIKKKEE